MSSSINNNMCTNICKCYSINNQKPKTVWDTYPDKIFNQYGRTNTINQNNWLVWSPTRETSYDSLKECFDAT